MESIDKFFGPAQGDALPAIDLVRGDSQPPITSAPGRWSNATAAFWKISAATSCALGYRLH